MKGDLNNMKRILAVLLMLAILLCGMTVTASAASPWNQDADGNWTYTKADGTLATDEWIKDGGKWYYFDGTIMLQNISWKIDDVWYAFDKSGAMANNGWIQCRWTYSEGVNLEWYYANKDGSLVKGWKKIDGKWYYFYGGQEEEDYWDPYMYSGSVREIGDKEYAFAKSGEMIVGWGQPWKGNEYVEDPDAWVYANADGSLVMDSWAKVDGKWYYFNGIRMIYNVVWPFVDGKPGFDENAVFYAFNKSGAMVDGAWYEYTYDDGQDSFWFYATKGGALKKGWLKDGGKWYYLDDNWCDMYANCMIVMSDGKTYGFKKNGEMAIGWWEYEGDWYYFSTSGAMVEKDWVQTGGKWYYLKEGGEMAKSETLTIDGKDYTFGADGALVK